MHEWHELTEKLFEDTPGSYDTIIRTYLEEKVQRLVETRRISQVLAMEILGLSPSKEVGECDDPECDSYKPHPPKPKDSEVCPHVYESDCHGIEMIKDPEGKGWAIGGTNHPERWAYDPWCGKPLPRPKTKTLQSKVKDLLGCSEETAFEVVELFKQWRNFSP